MPWQKWQHLTSRTKHMKRARELVYTLLHANQWGSAHDPRRSQVSKEAQGFVCAPRSVWYGDNKSISAAHCGEYLSASANDEISFYLSSQGRGVVPLPPVKSLSRGWISERCRYFKYGTPPCLSCWPRAPPCSLELITSRHPPKWIDFIGERKAADPHFWHT